MARLGLQGFGRALQVSTEQGRTIDGSSSLIARSSRMSTHTMEKARIPDQL